MPDVYFGAATGAAEAIVDGYAIRIALICSRDRDGIIARTGSPGNRHAIGLPLYAVGRRAVRRHYELGRLAYKDRLISRSRVAEHITQGGEDRAVGRDAMGHELIAIYR